MPSPTSSLTLPEPYRDAVAAEAVETGCTVSGVIERRLTVLALLDPKPPPPVRLRGSKPPTLSFTRSESMRTLIPYLVPHHYPSLGAAAEAAMSLPRPDYGSRALWADRTALKQLA